MAKDPIVAEYEERMKVMSAQVVVLERLGSELREVIEAIKGGKRLFDEERHLIERLTEAEETLGVAEEVAAEECDYPIWLDPTYGGIYPDAGAKGGNRFED